MKRFLLVFLAAYVSAFAIDTIAAGTQQGYTTVYTYDWTSDGSGNATGRTVAEVPGIIQSVATEPGTPAPTDNYDVVVEQALTNTAGTTTSMNVDLLGGQGSNRDTATNEIVHIWPSNLVNIRGKLQIEVTNAGAATSGRVQVFVYRTLAISTTGGQTFIPVSGSSGQILQYNTPLYAKYVSMNGDVYIADGGQTDVAPGDDQSITFGTDLDYAVRYQSSSDTLRVANEGGTDFAQFDDSSATYYGPVVGVFGANATLEANSTGTSTSAARLVTNAGDNSFAFVQWRHNDAVWWKQAMYTSALGTRKQLRWYWTPDNSVTDYLVAYMAADGTNGSSGSMYFLQPEGGVVQIDGTNNAAATNNIFQTRITADSSQGGFSLATISGEIWKDYIIGSSPNVRHIYRTNVSGGAAADQITITGGSDVTFANQIRGPTLLSSVATGTAPLTVSSTTKVSNLNVDQVDGADFAAPGSIGSGTPGSGAFTTLSATNVVTSTLATGTAPFSIASTTVVPNLNVSQLLGATWASPSAIGSTTPASVNATTLSATGAVSMSGNPPALTSTSTNTALNGNAIWRVTGVSSDTDHTGSTNVGRIDISADGNQTASHPMGMIVFQLGSGSAAMATEFTFNSSGLTLADGNYIAVGTSTGTVIGTATTQKIGFWNVTPVVQPSTTGTATGFTAGAGTAVNDASTFTGGTGSKAYNISDIVLALKQAGILAAS